MTTSKKEREEYKLFAESDTENEITSFTLRSEGAQKKICKQFM
jgi:hypothetical protein